MTSPCTFCRILSQELQASRLYEDEYVLAFLDVHPINEGHSLVIPKAHTASLTDLTDVDVQHMARVAKLVAAHLKRILPCEAISLSLADGAAAGQEVFHAHMHVIPRYAGDGFGWKFPPHYGALAERTKLEAIALRVRESLGT